MHQWFQCAGISQSCDAPPAEPSFRPPTDDRAQLQAQLKDLKQHHRSVQQQVLFAVSSPVFEF